VTAIATDPRRNLSFYSKTLGLRLVKRSVNQDDVSVYHLFYGDHSGSPGTSMTFFPYPNARPGQVGTGQVQTTQFLIPATAVEFWRERLTEAGVDVDEPFERFGDTVLRFRDPDGLPLELVARVDVQVGDPPDSPVPDQYAIRGFFGVTLSLTSAEATASLLESIGFTERATDHHRTRFVADGDLGSVVDVLEDPQAPRGQPGAGTVHHVAFQVTEADLEDYRNMLRRTGLRPTAVIDRTWFRSVYVRTHGGILFEFATKEPGYTVDEELDSLGSRLVLPERLEDRRDEIESALPDLDATR
jgi:glyoxalase family protein